MALQRCPEVTAAFMELGHEIAMPRLAMDQLPERGRGHRARAHRMGMACIQALTGERWPLGWYTGRDSPNTRRLVADHGGFEYDSDYYGDDLPFWLQVRKTDGSLAPHLVVPYTLDCNDMRFALPQGFARRCSSFLPARRVRRALRRRCRAAVDDEHRHALPPAGRPGRIVRCSGSSTTSSARPVWMCRRIDIARHWKQVHPFDAKTAFVWE
jgi:allantoinase